jgi:hypothetical protein
MLLQVNSLNKMFNRSFVWGLACVLKVLWTILITKLLISMESFFLQLSSKLKTLGSLMQQYIGMDRMLIKFYRLLNKMKLFSRFNWIYRIYMNVEAKRNVSIILLELVLQQDKTVYMMYATHLKFMLEKKLLIVLIILMAYIAVNFWLNLITKQQIILLHHTFSG